MDTDDAAELLPGDPLVMVVCQRVLTGRLSHDGAPLTEARTNVPRRVVHHSPGGFEWGYSGSGPADLALNILDLYVPVTTDTRPPVACFRGSCSRFAWDHHQSFKQLFLASMSRDGGTISAHAIGLWVMALWPPAPEEVLIP